MVASAEGIADEGKGRAHNFPGDVHGDLPGHGHVAAAAGALQIVHGHAVIGGHRLHHVVAGDAAGLGTGKNLPQGVFGQMLIHGLAGEGGIGHQAGEASFQLAHVVGNALGDHGEHAVVHLQQFFVGLLPKDSHPGFQIRLGNIGHQPPLEAAAQALFQLGDFPGRLVGGQDDLLPGGVQGVEGVEKFFLGARFAGEELNIVHHQHVDVPVFFPELGLGFFVEGVHHFVHKQLAGDVLHPQRGLLGQHIMPDSVHQVRFAQAHAAVNEQGIIGVCRGFRHRQRRRVGKPVVVAHHKGVEGIFGVQAAVVRRFFVGGHARPVFVRLGRGQKDGLQGPPRRLGQGIAHQHGVPRHHELMVKIRHRFNKELVAGNAQRTQGGTNPGIEGYFRHFQVHDLARLIPKGLFIQSALSASVPWLVHVYLWAGL